VVNSKNLRPIIEAHVRDSSYYMSDWSTPSKVIGGGFAKHGIVNHSIGEYVRGDIHTNTHGNRLNGSKVRRPVYRQMPPMTADCPSVSLVQDAVDVGRREDCT
jgi:hypothetical protein